MQDFVKMQLIALGRGTTVGAALVMTFFVGATFARTGVGVVTATLDAAVGFADAATNSLPTVFALTNDITVVPVDTSASVKTLNFRTGGAAAESAFEAFLWRRLTI